MDCWRPHCGPVAIALHWLVVLPTRLVLTPGSTTWAPRVNPEFHLRKCQKITMKVDGHSERRDQIRYGLRADADFEWSDTEGSPHSGRGFTRDISTKGMFICTDSLPSEKSDVQIEVSFRSISGIATNVSIRAKAMVIRVESAPRFGKPGGFAVLNRICRLHGGSPFEHWS